MADEQRFKMKITAQGRAKIAAAIANGTTLNLSQMGVGDGAGVAVEPDENQVSLVRECYRAGINVLTTDPQNPAYVVAELVIPTNVGGWTVREVALYDNSGALVAVGNCGETYKPVATEGSTREMVFKVVIEVGDTDAVNLVIDASVVLATRQWVEDNYKLAAQVPGGNAGDVLVKKSNQDGDTEWADLGDGIQVDVDANEERQDLAEGQDTVALNLLTTAGLAVYIDGSRLPKDTGWTIVDGTHLTLTTPATAGQTFLGVQNEPASALGFAQKDLNLADIPNKAAARQNLGFPASAISTVDQLKIAIAGAIYPVGTLLPTLNAANPFTYLGVGTWQQYGAGQTLVGFNASDSDFNAIGKTAGSKTTTLTTANLPAHKHTTPAQTITTGAAGTHSHVIKTFNITSAASGAHTHTISQQNLSTADAGEHTHLFDAFKDQAALDSGIPTSQRAQIQPAEGWNSGQYWSIATSSRQARTDAVKIAKGGVHRHTFAIPQTTTLVSATHTHVVTIPQFSSETSGGHSHSLTVSAAETGVAGEGKAFNNLPPYIVVYFWRRVA